MIFHGIHADDDGVIVLNEFAITICDREIKIHSPHGMEAVLYRAAKGDDARILEGVFEALCSRVAGRFATHDVAEIRRQVIEEIRCDDLVRAKHGEG